MSPKTVYFIFFVTLLQYCQGSTREDLHRYVQDLTLNIRNNFERVETEIRHLKKENKLLREELGYLKSEGHNNSRKCDEKTDVAIKGKRGITPYGTIAFSAVITKNFDSSIGTNHVFVYDHVESNLGGAYNSFSGTFIAPRPGTYAFLWTIFAEGRLDINGQNGEIQTELAVNGNRRGYAFTDTEVHYDDDQATGFVIVQLNQGDVVFVRSIGSTADVQGTFQHYYHGQWTFSGWKIA